jgi:3-oxoacyl-[acyl-carrier protein] reductase
MNLELAGKVALVTGSSRGIGEGVALGLAQEGCDVVLTGRDQVALDEVAGRIRATGRRASLLACDLREPSATTALVDLVKRDFGRLDILINNAGTTKRGDFLTMSDEDWADGFALKFFAHVRLTRAAWPMLKAANGAMIMMGGTSGRKPHHDFAIGSTVNAACATFGKAMADLGKTDGVRVHTIHPSHVDTERLTRRLKVEMEKTGKTMEQVRIDYCKKAGIPRFGTVQDVTDLILFLVSGRSTWMQGTAIDLDAGEIPVL